MGQFISIAISTEVVVSEKELTTVSGTREEAQSALAARFDPTLFDFTIQEENEEKYLVWQINRDIFCKQIVPMLKEFYPRYFKESRDKTYIETLEKLGHCSTYAEFEEIAEKKDYNFQENYNREYFEVGQFFRSVGFGISSILLTLEGKALLESYRYLFTYLTEIIRDSLSEHKLSGALHVLLTQ